MPSSYTTSLRLTLPATGELTGTWGTTVNTGITELLDSAVAGTTTISTWGGAGVPYTLSNTDGAADEARKMFIVATGAPGEAKNVICPAVSKLYFFRNDTTGGFALTLKTSGGSGIAVPAGQYKVLYCNGTNVVEAFNSLASLTLGTALAASSGGTGQSTYTTGDLLYASGASALSKLGIGTNGQILTSTGTAPQWSTLSGVAVTTFSAGTTGFTPSTATSGAVTLAGTLATTNGGTGLTSFTSGGVVYASSSSALATGSALTFDGTNLATTGGVVLNNAQYFYNKTSGGTNVRMLGINSGNTAYVGPIDSGPGDTLLNASSSSTNIQFYASGSEQMRLTSTGLGIGTSSPATKLHVNKASQTPGDTTPSGALLVTNTLAGAAGVEIGSGSPVLGYLQVRNTTNQTYYDFALQPSGGNVGIGTSSPVAKLDINGNQSFSTASFIIGYGLNTQTGTIAGATSPFYGLNMATFTGFSGQGIGLHGYYGLLFSTTGTEQMRLDASGNLGIGTSSPGYKLAVSTAASTTVADFASVASGDAAFIGIKSSGGTYAYIGTVSGAMHFQTPGSGYSTKMTLDSSGNLGLGVTPSAWTIRGLQVASSSVANDGNDTYLTANGYFDGSWKYISSDFAAQYYQVNGVHAWRTAPSGTAGNAISFTQAMTLDASGNLGIGTSSPAYKLDVAGAMRSVVSTGGTLLLGDANNTTAIRSIPVSGDSGMGFYTQALSGNSLRMTLDSSGNLGIGVTPSAWDTATFRTLQVGSGVGSVSLSGRTDNGKDLVLGSNIYYATGSFRYVGTGVATMYRQDGAEHQWFTAPSGTAGNAISFTQAMTLDASGNLGVGTTSISALGSGYTTQAISGTNGGGIRLYAGATEYGRWYADGSVGMVLQAVGASTPTLFYTNSAEAARITSGGNLLVGTTTSETARRVRIYGSEATSAATTLQLLTSTSGTGVNDGFTLELDGSEAYVWNYENANIRFGTNNTERARITSGGDLLVGTTTTAGTGITVKGTYYARSADQGSVTALAIDDSGVATLSAYRATGGTLTFVTANTSGGNTERMRLDSSGNLGLGVTPSAWTGLSAATLETQSYALVNIGTDAVYFTQNVSASGGVLQYRTNSQASRYQQLQGAHAWLTAPSGTAGNAITFTQSMTLDASGRLGIGLTSPTQQLDVALAARIGSGVAGGDASIDIGAGRSASGNAFVDLVGDLTYTDYGLRVIRNSGANANSYIQHRGTGELGLYTVDAGPVTFFTSSSERARITSGGALVVGNTAAAGFEVLCASVSDSGTPPFSSWNRATSGDNYFAGWYTEGTATIRGSITYNRAGGLVAYNTTSDYRAKDIIGPVQNPGATIDALKVYEGKMKGATQSRPMLVAHEAQAVAPYAVSGEKDAVNEDGTPKFQQMDVSSLVPLLLAEIQSLRARVAALESQP